MKTNRLTTGTIKYLVFIGLFAISPLSGAITQALDKIVAIVNDDVITATELDNEVQMISQQLRDQRMPLPAEDVLRKQILDRMIVLQIQLQDAERRHINVDDESVNRTIENIARQNRMGIDQFRNILQRDGVDFVQFRERIRDEMIIGQLQTRMVSNRITVTDQEINNFLTNQQAQGENNQEYRLGHILITIPETATSDQIQKAKQQGQDVLAELNQGKDFAEMAIAHSDGQNALSGGDLGWRKLAQLPSLFADSAINMEQGQISDLIRSPSGFHIVKLLEVRTNEPKHMVEQSKVRHILIKPDLVLTSEEAKKRAAQLKQRIEGGEDFAELAITHSDDKGSATEGGDLGWVNPGTMVIEFEEAMNQLQPQQISDPVQSRFGWHVIQVLERREFDDTEEFKRNQAREMVRQQKLEPALENFIRRMRDEAFVEIRI